MTFAIDAGALDALAEVGNIGAGTAATALAQMTGSRVDMAPPRVALTAVEDIPDRVGGGDTVMAAILLDVGGDVDGRMVFMLPAPAARGLVALLMGGDPAGRTEDDPFDEIELSALQEIGNVLAGSYLTALATMTGLRLEPSPPAVGVDMAAALLGDALIEVAEEERVALLIETAFADDDAPRVADLLFIPTPGALRTVLDRLGVAWGRP